MHHFFDRFFHRFFFHLGSIFLQKSTKILPKIDSKMHHFFDRFLHRFLDGPRRPKSAQDGDPSAKTAPRSSPRRPQEPSNRRTPGGPPGPQDGPRRLHDGQSHPRGPPSPPGRPITLFGGRFFKHQDVFWHPPGSVWPPNLAFQTHQNH